MRGRIAAVFITILIIGIPEVFSQDYYTDILKIKGISEAEELDEGVIEDFERLSRAPLELNLSSISELRASGLFSEYQMASIKDYRDRHGDILSVRELSLIDGFGDEYALALKPFVSFYSRMNVGEVRQEKSLSNRLMVKTGARNRNWNYGMKYSFSMRRAFDIGVSIKSDYGNRGVMPSYLGTYVKVEGRKHLNYVVVGDYYSRFGQGLVKWSGMTLSSLSTIESFSKKGNGISSTSSFSGLSDRGMAADFSLGRLNASLALNIPGSIYLSRFPYKKEPDFKNLGYMPVLNLNYFTNHGNFGATFTAGRALKGEHVGKVGLDFKVFFKGFNLFGEGGFDAVNNDFANILGISYLWDYRKSTSILLRYYGRKFSPIGSGGIRSGPRNSDELALSIGTMLKDFNLTLDFSHNGSVRRNQIKAYISSLIPITGKFSIRLRLTDTYRYKARNKADFRSDFLYQRGSFFSCLRLNGTYSKALGVLTYAEAGKTGEKFAFYGRGTFFIADNWEDRIYSYERDAPGNFNIPAYYGRGVAFSSNLRLKFRFAGMYGKFYARFSYLDYFKSKKQKNKPGITELKFQINLDF